MIKKIFSVYDSKAKTYNTPFLELNIGTAVRAFETAIKEGNTMFSKYPTDYTLFELGSFDDQKAKYELLATPISLVMAQELIPDIKES